MTREAFVSLAEFAPEIELDIRYAHADNFMGRPVAGYESPLCLLTRNAAEALRTVARNAEMLGLYLKVFDGYRPRRAVKDFVRWSTAPDDAVAKAHYYPNVDKRELLLRGYIAPESSHSRGSSVDLTLMRRVGYGRPLVDGPWLDNDELDMGSPFDFFDSRSHTLWAAVGPVVQANRFLLRDLMKEGGFAGIAEEWWHFTLVDEPFRLVSFDFPVAPASP